MTPFYDPPYDSPLEDLFAWNFVKYVADMDAFDKQVPVQTIAGTFILDFAAKCRGEVIAFECDGKEFHNTSRDEWRDAMILGSGQVTTIYRLRGRDLFNHMEDCLFAISKRDRGLFTDRGLANLYTLASEEARAFDYCNQMDIIMFNYETPEDSAEIKFTMIERKSRKDRKGSRVFWESIYSFALEHNGGELEDLMAKFREQSTEGP